MIRALIDHPMETGLRQDRRGNPIPRNTIETLSVSRGAKILVSATLGNLISRNPYIAFEVDGGAVGEEYTVSWTDSAGQVVTQTIVSE